MARIAVIGSGVVGQATGKGLLNLGHDVVFSDINPAVLRDLAEAGYEVKSPTELIGDGAEISMVCVSTPTVDNRIQLSFVQAAAAEIGGRLANGNDYHLVVIRSTVPPGTTEGLVLQTLERFSKKRAGVGFGLCMQPEFLRETSAYEDFLDPRLVLIGAYDQKSGDELKEVYANFEGVPLHVVRLEEAELEKYVHNLWNATKISFFNEMRMVAGELGIDPDRAFQLVRISAEAMWNPAYGTRDLGPYGGSCLPKDTEAFKGLMQERGWSMPLLEAVIGVNEEMKKRRRR